MRPTKRVLIRRFNLNEQGEGNAARIYVNPSMRFVDVALDVSRGPLGCGSVPGPGLVLAYPTFWNLRDRH
jgi:hypothetical protein